MSSVSVAPLTLMAYLSLSLGLDAMNSSSSLFWIDLMGALRAYRWVGLTFILLSVDLILTIFEGTDCILPICNQRSIGKNSLFHYFHAGLAE